jgi:hypothetical protein
VGEEPESSALQKLISVPGLVVMGVLGIAVTALARLFGPEHLLREVLTEVVASFGSTMLILAVFGLLFKSGLERLLRGAPGGEALAQAAERHKDVLQDLSNRDLDTRASGSSTRRVGRGRYWPRSSNTCGDRSEKEEGVAVPADWIGERVVLVAEGLNKRIRGELSEVSERGVVLVDAAREGAAPPRNPLFCPWGKVRFLELEVGQEQEAPD